MQAPAKSRYQDRLQKENDEDLSELDEDDAESEEELLFVLDISFRAIDDDNTEITLIERGLPHADPQTRIFSMEAWSSALEQLQEVMEEVID